MAFGSGPEWIAAASLAGIFVTFFLNLGKEKRDRRFQRKTEAYLDFLKYAAIEISPHSDRTSPEWLQTAIMKQEAVQRILVYGSPQVVAALREGYESDREWTDASKPIFEKLINAIRSDVGNKSLPDGTAVRLIIEPFPKERQSPKALI